MRIATTLFVAGLLGTLAACSASSEDASTPATGTAEEELGGLVVGELLPTGARITPTAAPGATFERLDPALATHPGFTAGQAVRALLSPDGRTLLVLTSGYNRVAGPDGAAIAAESNEYVFVYDVSRGAPRKTQVLPVPNAFLGLAWSPSGDAFHVSGGVDDVVRTFTRDRAGAWTERSPAIALGHRAGLGLGVAPEAAGLAVTRDGRRLAVANFENDSLSIVDLARRVVVAEVELRPGKIDAAKRGVAGGEYPIAVAIARGKAYVSSARDGEVVVVDLDAAKVVARVKVGQQPGALIADRAERLIFVANGSSDTVSVIDAARDRVVETIGITAPRSILGRAAGLRGANPNGLALSPDERALYVTNGGTNDVAVVRLATERDGDDDDDDDDDRSRVVGLVPTGWYPNGVAVSADGERLWVVNGKSNAGPNGGACRDDASPGASAGAKCAARNQYVWQLTKAGLLSMPTPSPWTLGRLTLQSAQNNGLLASHARARAERAMAALRHRVQHVVYVVKENRTYDQVLGDLGRGDGDPKLTLFGEPITPNHHAIARRFVTLDRFLDAGEVSGDGWNWTTAARTTDFTEKTVSVNYAGRGLSYDWEGTNRNVNVAYPTLAARAAALPATPNDPDLLPGTRDVAAPVDEREASAYVWDAALRAGESVRNYGFFGDLTRYSLPAGDPALVAEERDPFAKGLTVFYPAKPALMPISDPYFRGFDMRFADYWRFQEWKREFDGYVAAGRMPSLELVRFPHDHFGSFADALDGVSTPDTQIADNDYAVGMLVDAIAKSPFADSTVIFVLEDDAQNGGDHVDAHRSVLLVAGACVKRGAVVSTPYDTVNVVKTIEALLGLEPLGLTDGVAAPMADLFDPPWAARPWGYDALVPEVLRTTALPLPARTPTNAPPFSPAIARPVRDAAWWAEATKGQDFTREDHLDVDAFDRALREGMRGGDARGEEPAR